MEYYHFLVMTYRYHIFNDHALTIKYFKSDKKYFKYHVVEVILMSITKEKKKREVNLFFRYAKRPITAIFYYVTTVA